MDSVIVLEAIKAAASGAAGELGKELLGLLRQRFQGKPTALTVLDEFQRRPDVWEKPLQSTLEETGAGADPEVLDVTRRIAKQINITQSASGQNVAQAGRDIGTLIQAGTVSLGNTVAPPVDLGKLQTDESAMIINDALQSGGMDETWVVVGARIEREDPQALWTLPEIDRLSTAAYRISHGLSAPSISTGIIAFWKEGAGIKRRIEFHSIGVVLAMFSWSVNPFPAAAAVLGLEAGVSLIQNQDVWEVFHPAAPAELTLGVVSWPDQGLSAKGFLKQTPRPVGSPKGRPFHQRYAIDADTDSWSLIGDFMTLLLTEAGYRVNPAFLSQRPSVAALIMLMQEAGLALP